MGQHVPTGHLLQAEPCAGWSEWCWERRALQTVACRPHCVWRDERHTQDTSLTQRDAFITCPPGAGLVTRPVVAGKSGMAVAAAVSAPPTPPYHSPPPARGCSWEQLGTLF